MAYYLDTSAFFKLVVRERAAELDPQVVRSLAAIHLASALALGDEL